MVCRLSTAQRHKTEIFSIDVLVVRCEVNADDFKGKPPNEAADQMRPKATALPCYGRDSRKAERGRACHEQCFDIELRA